MIEDLWYKNTVIYSLDLETFMDSNGDGSINSADNLAFRGRFNKSLTWTA